MSLVLIIISIVVLIIAYLQKELIVGLIIMGIGIVFFLSSVIISAIEKDHNIVINNTIPVNRVIDDSIMIKLPGYYYTVVLEDSTFLLRDGHGEGWNIPYNKVPYLDSIFIKDNE